MAEKKLKKQLLKNIYKKVVAKKTLTKSENDFPKTKGAKKIEENKLRILVKSI